MVHLLPRDTSFFKMFSAMSDNLIAGARALVDLFADYREDIHQLASKLDDVLDFINASGARLVMYRITTPPPAAGELAKIILMQCQELQKAVALLQKNGNILAHCMEINRLENEADQVSQQAIARLFDNEKDPINLIKIKELLEFLERATDKAEDVANVLETVVLKNT